MSQKTTSVVQEPPETVTNDEELRDRGLAIDGEPHQDREILKYLKETCILSYREAAERIEEIFGYSCSKSTIKNWVNKHDIRDPLSGPFADIYRKQKHSSTEPAQPESFWIERNDDTPVHPFDTELHQTKASGGGWWVQWLDSESSLTSHFTTLTETDSTNTNAEKPDSDSGTCTGVYKGLSDVPPESYRVQRGDREVSLVAPPGTPESDDYPDLYSACGCGSCDERHYLDGDGGTINCQNPVPVTIGGARRIYQTAEGSNVANGVDGNDVQQAKSKYARLMKTDRAVLRRDPVEDGAAYSGAERRYDDWTTVLLSLRVSPLDDENKIVTPYTLVDDCLDGWREARNKLPGGYDFSVRYWLSTGTDEWASPHVHAHLWIADEDDEVVQREFRPTVQKFVQAATFAPVDAHFNVDDGSYTLTEGVVRVEHDPLLADVERLGDRLDTESSSGAFDDILALPPETLLNGKSVQSRGAIYVGSQHLGFALRGSERPADAEAAVFFDVGSRGRNRCHGCNDFYDMPDVHDVLTE